MHVQAAELATLQRIDPVKAYPLALNFERVAVEHLGGLPPPRAAQISRYCKRLSRTEADSVFLSRRPASSIRVACSRPWASR